MDTRKSDINQLADLGAGVTESLTIMAIFTMFLKPVLIQMLEETARFILFPLAGALALVRAGLAWRQAHIEDHKNGTLEKAAVETLTALAIGTAVVGGFVAATIFGVVSPFLFAAVMAAKTLFHAGAACYYMGRAAMAKAAGYNESAVVYKEKAKGNAIGAVALLLATAAVTGVMILAKPILAIVGLVSGVIATWTQGSAFIKTYTKVNGNNGYTQISQNDADASTSSLTGNTQMQQKLSSGAIVTIDHKGTMPDHKPTGTILYQPITGGISSTNLFNKFTPRATPSSNAPAPQPKRRGSCQF